MQWLNKVDDALDRVFLRPAGQTLTDSNNNERQTDSLADGPSAHSTNNDPSSPHVGLVGGINGTAVSGSSVETHSAEKDIQSRRGDNGESTGAETGKFLGNTAFSSDISNDGGMSSEDKLKNLASMLQQLEKDDIGHCQTQQQEKSDGGGRQKASEEDTDVVGIPLLPMSSVELTQEVGNQIRIKPQSNIQMISNSIQSTQTQLRPSARPPPPPPPNPTQQQSTPSHVWEPSTPHASHHVPSPLPTPRITPRTPVRPTPGIIRRKIRSPSISPSNSTNSLDPSRQVGGIPPPPSEKTGSLLNDSTREEVRKIEAHHSSTRVRPRPPPPPPPLGAPPPPSQPSGRASMQQKEMVSHAQATVPSTAKREQFPYLPSAVAIQAATTANLMQQSPVPSANIMVHRSPRLDNSFFDESSVEDEAKSTNEQAMNPSGISFDDTAPTKQNRDTPDQNIPHRNTQDDDNSSSTTFHSHISNRSDLTDDDRDDDDSHEQQIEDFALPTSVSEPLSVKSWNPSFNCYGIVHVRVLRAQRLPCAAGTAVVASLTLPPWKGKIRIPGRMAMDGPDGAGVCLRWDRPPSKQEKSRGSVNETTDDTCSHSMVHAYNNKDTPIPIVSLTLSVSSMGGVFEKFLCSVAFSCQDIMKSPGAWTSRWYSATTDHMIGSTDASSPSSRQHSSLLDYLRESSLASDYDFEYEDNPLILLEACFEPKLEESEQMISEDSDTLGPIPRDLVIRSSPDRLRHMPDTVYSSIEDDTVSKTSSLTSVLARHHPTKAHLLRVRTFWTPAWCAVCSKIITSGWLQGSFECEACHIYCCKDCQLQVDVSLPCGSELSRIAVNKAQQYQLGQVMTTLAPYTSKDASGQKNAANDGNIAISNTISKIEGVGVLSIRILNACLFDKSYPSDTEPMDIFKVESNNLRYGDHYVRISWLGSKDSKRTKTVHQTGKPVFDADQMQFDVAHYGMEYKLEVVDANTDGAVGSCLLSPQALLQMQRDNLLAHWDQLLLSLLHFCDESETRRMKLELRSSTKDGFGLNYYNAAKILDDSRERSSSSALAGEISGWIEFDVNFQEDTSGLFYSRNPRQCPPRATEEFDIAMINLHIARIGAIIEDVQKFVSNYMYLISWENMYLTATSLAVFVITTLRFNLEYLGALPVGMLVLYMLYLSHIRLSGHFKDRWISKEKKILIESESKIDQQYTIHRPIGLLQISKIRGKNLRSRELGLPGSFYVSVSFDPLRYASEKKKKSISKLDAASSCTHQIGSTVSPGITSSPIWTSVKPSAELSRLKHLLPDDHLLGEDSQSNEALVKYPIPQPITKDKSLFLTQTEEELRNMEVGLSPWSSSLGAVVLQVRFSEVLGSFQLFENVLGEVVLPLSKLAAGQSVEGWFRLLNAGTTETAPGESPDEDTIKQKAPSATDDSESIHDDHEMALPELYVKVKFSATSSPISSSSLEIETSRVICEEMVRTASLSKEGNIGVMIGSSINTINTVRTLGGTLQNQISNAINMIEMVRNAFNFSSPRITCILLVCLSILWFILALIPTRFVVLLAGLGQYGATYYSKFVYIPIVTKPEETDEDEADAAATGNIVENLFLSIPTDEDLRRAYFWEARRVGEREREKYANTKRQTRLKKLWKASWHGTVKIKEKRLDSSSPKNTKKTWSWETAFILIEGHRFIWWRSEKHFDTGEAPLGQIFFAGHSGLAGLSPLDLRELSKEEIPFIVSVFGRGTNTQQKLTLLAPTQKVKEGLENAVIAASSDRKAD